MRLSRVLDVASVAAVAIGAVTLLAPSRPAPEPSLPRTAGSRVEPGAAGRPDRSDTPLDIPARDWKDILRRTYDGISKDRVLAEAAGVTFYGLLALFPALGALVSLYGLFADPATVSDQVKALSGILPGGGMDVITQQLHALASSPPRALGVGLMIGLLTSIWSANAGMKAMFDALNAVYEEVEKRSYIRRTILSLLFTLGALAFLVLALITLVAIPQFADFSGMPVLNQILVIGRWPLLLVVVTLFLSVVYRYGPCRGRAPWRWVTWGGAAATLGWLLVSAAFSYYTAHFGSYNKTYGSLGAVIGFMTWIWLSTTVVLVGAELDSQMERKATAARNSGQKT